MDRCFINPNYANLLSEAGLDTLDKLLNYQGGEPLSVHPRRGSTRKVTLSDGTVVFVKIDNFTYFKQVLKDLFLHFRAPAPNSVRERAANGVLRQHNFNTPETIAWWTRAKFGYPGAAAMITVPVPGMPLDKFLLSHQDQQPLCQKVIETVAAELSRMLNLGYDWRDHKPEHFFVDVTEDKIGVAIIDLERMRLEQHTIPEKLKHARLESFLLQCERFRYKK
jgi:hypothetical protein